MTDLTHSFLRLYTNKSSALDLVKLKYEKIEKVNEAVARNHEIAQKRLKEQERRESIHPGLYDKEFINDKALERDNERKIQAITEELLRKDLLSFSKDTQDINLHIQLKSLKVV